MSFRHTTFNSSSAPAFLYSLLGPFGCLVTAPLWLLFAPLFLGEFLGPISLILMFPLLIIFLLTLPLFLVVLVVEKAIQVLAATFAGIDIRWVRKRTSEEKSRDQMYM